MIDLVELLGEIAATCDLAVNQAATPQEQAAARRRSMRYREMQLQAMMSEAQRTEQVRSALGEMAASGLYDHVFTQKTKEMA